MAPPNFQMYSTNQNVVMGPPTPHGFINGNPTAFGTTMFPVAGNHAMGGDYTYLSAIPPAMMPQHLQLSSMPVPMQYAPFSSAPMGPFLYPAPQAYHHGGQGGVIMLPAPVPQAPAPIHHVHSANANLHHRNHHAPVFPPRMQPQQQNAAPNSPSAHQAPRSPDHSGEVALLQLPRFDVGPPAVTFLGGMSENSLTTVSHNQLANVGLPLCGAVGISSSSAAAHHVGGAAALSPNTTASLPTANEASSSTLSTSVMQTLLTSNTSVQAAIPAAMHGSRRTAYQPHPTSGRERNARGPPPHQPTASCSGSSSSPSSPTIHGQLMINYLDVSVNAQELASLFQKFGPLNGSKIVFDDNNQSRCYGFVYFKHRSDAQRAIDEMDGSMYRDKKLRVHFSDNPNPTFPQ